MERRDYTKTNIIDFDRAKNNLHKKKEETVNNQEPQRKLSTSEFIFTTVERLTQAFKDIPKDVALCILYQVISNFVDDTDDRQD